MLQKYKQNYKKWKCFIGLGQAIGFGESCPWDPLFGNEKYGTRDEREIQIFGSVKP